MNKHPRADLYREERLKGLTYREIAEKHGVSYQAVAISCGSTGYGFKAFTKKTCVYPNLRKWLNDNEISLREFMRRCDLICSGNNSKRYRDYIRGRCCPPKKTIDVFLQVTGLTYEQLFQKDVLDE